MGHGDQMTKSKDILYSLDGENFCFSSIKELVSYTVDYYRYIDSNITKYDLVGETYMTARITERNPSDFLDIDDLLDMIGDFALHQEIWHADGKTRIEFKQGVTFSEFKKAIGDVLDDMLNHRFIDIKSIEENTFSKYILDKYSNDEDWVEK
jgi:hypothetical protein